MFHVSCNQADVNTTYLGPATKCFTELGLCFVIDACDNMFFFLPEMSLVNAIVRWTSIWY